VRAGRGGVSGEPRSDASELIERLDGSRPGTPRPARGHVPRPVAGRGAEQGGGQARVRDRPPARRRSCADARGERRAHRKGC
jgi:hypothetical protein